MKKPIATSLTILAMVGPCSAEEKVSNSYRVLSDGPFLNPESKTSVAYVITSNPPMAILVFPGGSGTMRRIKTGTLTDCAPVDSAQVVRYKQGAIKMYGLVSQMKMGIQLGKVPNADEQRVYDSSRNFVAFVNEAEEKPYFQCRKQ